MKAISTCCLAAFTVETEKVKRPLDPVQKGPKEKADIMCVASIGVSSRSFDLGEKRGKRSLR